MKMLVNFLDIQSEYTIQNIKAAVRGDVGSNYASANAVIPVGQQSTEQ